MLQTGPPKIRPQSAPGSSSLQQMEKMLHIKLMGWLRLSRTGWLEVMRQLEKQQRGAEEAARVVAGRAASVRMAGRHEKGTKRGLFPT